MKNQIQRTYRHVFKNITSLLAIAGAICTVIAYFIGESTISSYNLSSLFLVPNIGKSVHGILLSTAFSICVIVIPIGVYYIVKNKLFLNEFNSFPPKLILSAFAISLVLIGSSVSFLLLLLIVSTHPLLNFSVHTVQLITWILIVISAVSYLVWLCICYFNKEENLQTDTSPSNKASMKEKVKRIFLIIYIISYGFLLLISIISIIQTILSPYSKSNEYEYITTKEHGDCVVLIRNDTQYVMEAFDYDEATGHLTVYAGEYYVQDLSDVTIRKITFESEDIVNTIKPQDDKKE